MPIAEEIIRTHILLKKKSEYAIVPEAGHDSYLDNPALVNREILRFIGIDQFGQINCDPSLQKQVNSHPPKKADSLLRFSDNWSILDRKFSGVLRIS